MLEYIIGLFFGFVIFTFFFKPKLQVQPPPKTPSKLFVTLSLTEPLSESQSDSLLSLLDSLNLVLIVSTSVDSPALLRLKTKLRHKLLLSEKTEGRVSMVRQLQPSLHLDSDASVVDKLTGKVHKVLLYDDFDSALSQLKSLASLNCFFTPYSGSLTEFTKKTKNTKLKYYLLRDMWWILRRLFGSSDTSL